MNPTKIIGLVIGLMLVQTELQCASADDDEYFQKSIFRSLKEKNGQFSSDMQMILYRFGHRHSVTIKSDQEEKFSFKSNTGIYNLYGGHFDSNQPEHTIYVNNKEIYTFLNRSRNCMSLKLDKYEKTYHLR